MNIKENLKNKLHDLELGCVDRVHNYHFIE